MEYYQSIGKEKNLTQCIRFLKVNDHFYTIVIEGFALRSQSSVVALLNLNNAFNEVVICYLTKR